MNECVQVAFLNDGAVAIRDSTSLSRAELRFTRGEWSASPLESDLVNSTTKMSAPPRTPVGPTRGSGQRPTTCHDRRN
jgi:hypothetical protein